MGFKLSYILAQGATVSMLCDLLGLETSVENSNRTDQITGKDLATGFALILVHRYDSKLLNVDRRKLISMSWPLLHGELHEGAMCSSAARWENGQQVWSVGHDAEQNDHRDLVYSGTLPAIFEEIRSQMAEKQDEEDEDADDDEVGCDYMFEIPVELIDRLTGFNYSRSLEDVVLLREKDANGIP